MTKKFLAVIGAFIISFTFSYTVKATISNGITGEPQVKIQTKSANANSGEITFEVETSSAGLYRMDLWQCPARKSDKTLQTYTFELNGKTLNATSTPEIAGWSVLSYPETIYLKNGKNTISVKIDMPYVPNVEFIELTKDSSRKKSRMQASNAYKDYISAIRSASLSTKSSSVIHAPSLPSGDSSLNPPVDANKDTTSLILSEPDFTPYGYNYHRIPWFGYTFYTTAYFTEGQTITCTSEGINGVQHIMEIFSADSPKDYSWTKPSTNGKINMAVTIPKAGKYYIKVRTFKNGTTGLCNLYINNLMSYEQVPICTMGVKSYFAKEVGNYTIFTANCVSDPILWSVKGQCYDGTIYAFNDDYASAGDFVWGRNSRINHKYFTVNDYSRILISSASSFNPTGSCDLYVGCKKSTAYLHFDKLKEDDAIASAPASTDYNCISWSGGITSYWEWPGNPASEYYIEGDELASFDLFYSSERYPGCTRYTRTGATAANSVVDLWGTQENGVKVLTHGSITRNSDGNHHGYDWESKPGAMTRTFHPRNALEGIDYGKVLYYYKPANNSTEEYISLEQSIADNKAIMEKVELTLGQEAYISEYIADLSSQAVLNFNNLYRNWENIWNNSIFSNPDAQKGSVAYQQLLSACRNNNLNILFMTR